MTERSNFRPRKVPIASRLSKIGSAAKVLVRLLGLNDFDEDTSSSRTPWTQGCGGSMPISSPIPICTRIGRRWY
jgi:hypothetical protein